jgi:fluoroquinolone transport system permease protein
LLRKENEAVTIVEIARALGPVDAKSIRRDPLLRWLIFYPLFLAVVIRWGMPILGVHLRTRFDFDLQPYYPLLMSFVMLMTPMLAGVVIGFLLLDQRDDQTLTALQVTPLTLSGYFAYRIAVPTALSFAITVAVFPITRLVELSPFTLTASAAGASLLAPLYALFLGTFANNKVQGFALTKALGILLVPPLVAYFVRSPWQLLFGLDPLYWPAKFLWSVSTGNPALMYLLAGIAFHLLLLRLLMRRMMR